MHRIHLATSKTFETSSILAMILMPSAPSFPDYDANIGVLFSLTTVIHATVWRAFGQVDFWLILTRQTSWHGIDYSPGLMSKSWGFPPWNLKFYINGTNEPTGICVAIKDTNPCVCIFNKLVDLTLW